MPTLYDVAQEGLEITPLELQMARMLLTRIERRLKLALPAGQDASPNRFEHIAENYEAWSGLRDALTKVIPGRVSRGGVTS